LGGILDLVSPPPRPPYYGHRRHYSDDSGSSTVARVQRALRSHGYYRGSIDGDAGSGTRAAIRNFREDNGLGSSSRIDGSLLRALGL
jgi:peptidoglycan hydrolase-like protein with peptidoglycan-binding domain